MQTITYAASRDAAFILFPLFPCLLTFPAEKKGRDSPKPTPPHPVHVLPISAHRASHLGPDPVSETVGTHRPAGLAIAIHEHGAPEPSAVEPPAHRYPAAFGNFVAGALLDPAPALIDLRIAARMHSLDVQKGIRQCLPGSPSEPSSRPDTSRVIARAGAVPMLRDMFVNTSNAIVLTIENGA